MKTYTHPYFIAGLVPALFFLVFYFYPLSGIFAKGFLSKGTSGTDLLAQFFGSARLMRVIWFTFWQAAVSTLLTLMFALPAAFAMANYRFRFKKTLTTLASIPFVLPAVVVAAALKCCFGPAGWITEIQHPLILIFMAHVFYNFSVMLRIITGYWTSLQGEIKEAAAMLGASPAHTFFHVTLPLLRPAIWAGTVLVFIFCFSSFGIILIFAGPEYATIEAEIYRQAAHLFNLPMASLLSLVQILFTFCLMALYTRFTRKAARFSPRVKDVRLQRPARWVEKLLVAATATFIIILCATPLVTLAASSLVHNNEISLIFYRALFENATDSVFYVPPFKAVQYSFVFAAGALVTALGAGVCAALFITYCDRRIQSRLTAFFDPLFMLPLSTSAVTLGFGIIITLDHPPLNLRASPLLIPMVHALVGFPFVLRTLLPALRTIPEHFGDAAAMLGAGPLKVLRFIDLPLTARAIAAGAVFAFTVSLGEFGATIFTAPPATPTIPLAIYRFLGQPGAMNYGQAMAVSTILMAATAVGYIVIDRLSPGKRQGF